MVIKNVISYITYFILELRINVISFDTSRFIFLHGFHYFFGASSNVMTVPSNFAPSIMTSS